MLTPQQVESQKFVKAVFGGYDMASVDDFLEQLTADYTALFKENAVLKGKLKVLVESVEEYRSVDDSMRKALLSAQKMANDTLAAAKKKADELMQSARTEADGHLENIMRDIAAEEKRLALAKEQTAEFIASVKKLYSQQLELLTALPGISIPEPQPKQQDSVADTAREIADFVSSSFGESEKSDGAPQDTLPFESVKELSPDEADSADPKPGGKLKSKLFNLNLDVNIPEIKDEDLGGEDTGPLFTDQTNIDFENLQFGDKYRDNE